MNAGSTAQTFQYEKNTQQSAHETMGSMNTVSAKEQDWKNTIHQKLLDIIDLSMIVDMEPSKARAQIREITHNIMNDESVPLPVAARQRLVKEIEDELLGLGPLEPLLADHSISDILVNGAGIVFVERGGKLEQTDIRFKDDNHLLNIIDRIVSRVGRRIDESSPMVDARLKDGSRVNAIIPPLAIDGPSLSIRRFAIDRLSLDDLIQYGSVAPIMRKFCRVLSKLN